MHHISKNWEHVFHFQYKVAIGQCGIESQNQEKFNWKQGHTVLWQLYIENQKHVPNFWIYDAFLLDKQLSIWRIVQNRCPFL